MFVAVWRFTTDVPAEFERHYGPDGSWAELFRRDPAYVRTDLLRDGTSYVTLDWWISRAAYDTFRAKHATDYATLDFMCEAATTEEEKLGEFETADTGIED